jgi:nitroreductase
MMNEIVRSLFDRKSIRQFEERPITQDEKTTILKAALQAPTAGNQNLYTILDITDPALKQALSEYCDNQPFIAKAPMVLIFLADSRRWFDSYNFAGLDARPPGEGDMLLSLADAVIAAQNTVVAAEAMGIGSCYIGDILEQEEKVREALALDDYVFPAAMLVYGYPTEGQKQRAKPVRPQLSCIVQENRYHRMGEEEHKKMFLEKGNIKKEEEYKDFMAAFYKRKYMCDFAKEMNRSARRYIEHFFTQN